MTRFYERVAQNESDITDIETPVTDGSAAAAGEVGEFVSAYKDTGSQSNGGVADTFEDATDLSINLSSGSWLIGYEAGISKNADACSTVLTDGANTLQAGTLRTILGGSTGVLTATTLVNISSPTTYKIRWRQQTTAADGYRIGVVTGAFTDPDGGSRIWAIRVR